MDDREEARLPTALASLYDQQLRGAVAGCAATPFGRYRSVHFLDELFHDLVRLSGPDTFVEAGAFDAAASRRVRRELPTTRVVAFEANPHSHAHFRADAEAAGVEYLNVALSDSPGTVTLQLVTRRGGMPVDPVRGDHSLRTRTRAGAEDDDIAYEQVDVAAVALDDVLPEVGRVAMWVDVEGAAAEVLGGATSVLGRCDVVKIEVEEELFWEGQWRSRDVLAHLIGHGLLPVARDIQGVNQYNVIALGETFGRRGDVLARLEAHGRFVARELRRTPNVMRRNPTARRIARAGLKGVRRLRSH